MSKTNTPLRVLTASLVAAFLAAPVVAQGTASTVDVTVVGFNDFHGNLEANRFTFPDPADRTKTKAVNAGGIEAMSTKIKEIRAQRPNTLVVGGGDLVGASPLVSALLADEPTIRAMNALNVAVSTVGNHEFDKGVKELLRLQNGGCADAADPTQACKFSNTFQGANFQFLAANVIDTATGKTILPAYAVKAIGGVRVAFVGAVLRETPTIVVPTGVAGLRFGDEADAVNAAVQELKAQGVEAVIALIHQGGNISGGNEYFDTADCATLSGPIVDIVKKLDKTVDFVMTGHTHQGYQCRVDGRLVTQGNAFGRLLTRVDFQVDRKTRDIVPASIKSQNVVVDAATTAKDPVMTGILSRANALVAPIRSRAIASLGVDNISRTANPAGESPLGKVIADAQLFATRDAAKGGAVVSFMNPGGIRADLPPSAPTAPTRRITFGDAFTVQPFGNSLVVKTLTGAQIERLLEQQFTTNRILQVSQGFTYTWDASKPVGDRVDPASIRIGGTVVSPTATYRVTMNSFLADGGDGFSVFREGTDALGGEVDLEAFQNYLKAKADAGTPLVPPTENRIVRLN